MIPQGSDVLHMNILMNSGITVIIVLLDNYNYIGNNFINQFLKKDGKKKTYQSKHS